MFAAYNAGIICLSRKRYATQSIQPFRAALHIWAMRTVTVAASILPIAASLLEARYGYVKFPYSDGPEQDLHK